MPHHDIALARQTYDDLERAVREGDFESALRDRFDPGVEWVPMEGSPDGTATLHGHAPVRARLAEMLGQAGSASRARGSTS